MYLYVRKEMLQQLSYMTWKNPIFMLVFFSVIWFLPGILIRRRVEFLNTKKREAERASRLSKLYPKK